MCKCIANFFYVLMIFVFSISPFFALEAKSSELDSTKEQSNEIDPEASPPLKYKETPLFSWGAKLNFDERIRDNRDLDHGDDDRDTRFKGSLSVAGLMGTLPSILDSRLEIFGELRIQREIRHKEGRGKSEDESTLDFKKGHVTWWHRLAQYYPSLSLQVGRQRFKDFREWIFDETLDAIRLHYQREGLALQLSYSSNIFDPEDVEDRINNLILYGIYDIWKKDKAAVYIINRRGRFDEEEPEFKLSFIGLSWKGQSIKKQKYWLEAAIVRGDEAGKDVSGYGFDVGWTSRFKHRLKPALTVGYAFGSGDENPDDNQDRNFRQTGLQDNSAKLRGVIRVEQYGELFEPELSNLMVGTLAFGIRPLKKASIDLVYHYFHQVWAFQERENELRDVGIKPDPNGKSRSLGEELDLIFGWKVTPDLKVEALVALFLPGSAFPDTNHAFLGKIKVRYVL